MDTSAQPDRTDMPVVVYTAESPVRHPWQLLRSLVADSMAGRQLAWRLLVRNISSQYRETMLGYLWALLPPLVTTGVWVFLSSQRVVSFDTGDIPYPAFVLIGTVLWQTFGDAINAPLRVITASKPMLSKVNFPHESLLLVALGEVLFNFAVRCVLLIAVFLLLKVPLGLGALLVPLGVAAVILVGMTLGLVLTPMGLLYQDIRRGLQLILQFWMYLTPVIYPPPQTGIASWLNYINPVSPLISTTRDWIVGGTALYLNAFCIVVVASLLLLVVATAAYRVVMPILIERMGS